MREGSGMKHDTTKPVPESALRSAWGLTASCLFCGAASLFLVPGGFLPFMSVPAIVCGHWARRCLAKNQRRTAESWVSLAGLLLAYLTLGLGLLMAPWLLDECERARRINCASNLRAVCLASKMYASDYAESFPPHWRTLWDNRYCDVGKIWICPSTKSTPATESAQLADPKHCDYVYFGAGLNDRDFVSTTGGQTMSNPVAARTILAADRTGNHRGYWNVVFGDGHCGGLTAKPGIDFATAVRAKGWVLPGAAAAK